MSDPLSSADNVYDFLDSQEATADTLTQYLDTADTWTDVYRSQQALAHDYRMIRDNWSALGTAENMINNSLQQGTDINGFPTHAEDEMEHLYERTKTLKDEYSALEDQLLGLTPSDGFVHHADSVETAEPESEPTNIPVEEPAQDQPYDLEELAMYGAAVFGFAALGDTVIRYFENK